MRTTRQANKNKRRAMLPHRPPAFRAQGFTLIEVLMVVVLVGIIASVVIFYVDPKGPEREVNDEMDRLMAVISLASDEAMADNRELGMKVQSNGYGFLAFNEDKQIWEPFSADDSFKVHKLPDDIELRVLRAAATKLPRDAKAQAANPLEPDLLILSSGETTPVTLELDAPKKPDAVQRLQVDEFAGLQRQVGEGGNEQTP